MARNKEQWKAQQRAQHNQTQSKGFVQMKRPLPHPPGVRPMAPPASSALFLLGRPANGAPVVAAVQPEVFKPDPIQTPSQNGSSSGEAIDLTLDGDDEEEDEPMGAQQSVTAAATAATVSSAAAGTAKSSTLNGNEKENASVTQSLQATSDMMVPEVEENESDVDEDWPVMPSITSSPLPVSLASSVHDLATSLTSQSVPLPTTTPVSEQASRGETQNDVGAALDAIRQTTPFFQDKQEESDLERSTQMVATRQQTSTPPLYGDGDDRMDVDEDLPNQTQEAEEDTTDSPSTTDRMVEAENLEDGEIFEEGAAPKPSMQVQQSMIRGNRPEQFNAYPMDSMGIRPHQRVKKQKKRGKKKSKRKLEAMQMMHTSPGEMAPDFERMNRQRPFADALPPEQYTLAMMRNDSRSNSMNIRPVFRDPPSASFQPGRPVVGGLYPPMRPPPQQLQNPRMPPPPPPLYEDSQILRVNRQGGMEMLAGEAGRLSHAMFSEPPVQGGFKYRSVSITPPRPMTGGTSPSLQRSVSDQSHLPPIPHQSHAATPSPVRNKERNDSADLDLDTLRAAALRSKVNRSLKSSSSTPTPTEVSVVDSSSSSLSSSSPARPTHDEGKRSVSEPASPNSESELRLEILRSMTRNRKRAVTKAPDAAQVLTPSFGESNAIDSPEQSTCAKAVGENVDNLANEKSSVAQTEPTVVAKSLKSTQLKTNDVADAERMVIDESSSETDKSPATSKLNGGGNKAETSSSRASELAKPSAGLTVKTPEFRPLTACSQSLVITLNPDDFSPRNGEDDTRTKSTASSSLQDAIKEMRQKIAEREKEQTTRLLENAAARIFKHPSGSSSSPASLSSTPHRLSPKKKVSSVVTLLPGASGNAPEVKSSAIGIAKKPPFGPVAEESKIATVSKSAQAISGEGKEKPSQQRPSPEILPSTEAATANKAPEKPVSKSQERGDSSAVSINVDMYILSPVLQPQVPASSDGQDRDRASQPCDVSTKSDGDVRAENFSNALRRASTDASMPDEAELDFDAIRAEFEQCEMNIEEADAQIARLSDEMAQLQKLLPVESTMGGA
ncbi:hypothetical protein, variant 1 [Phytophthora nicotianae]|uniref:Uncharacterized protein n=1 Tax=Phytophthora nicotianae TaxID=4792 RepID=W2G1V3_PHYNI|nr:hypothetical protein L915_16712 [Phytophthora nicotianae]ETK76972.1 hypothetical protein, variant 1 [Phytophthora nicotianae]